MKPSTSNQSALALVSRSSQISVGCMIIKTIITFIHILKGESNPSDELKVNAHTPKSLGNFFNDSLMNKITLTNYRAVSSNSFEFTISLSRDASSGVVSASVLSRSCSLITDQNYSRNKGKDKIVLKSDSFSSLHCNNDIPFAPGNIFVPTSTLNAFPFSLMNVDKFYPDGVKSFPSTDLSLKNFVSSTQQQLKKFNDNATDMKSSNHKNKVNRTAYLFNDSTDNIDIFRNANILDEMHLGKTFSDIYVANSGNKDLINSEDNDFINKLEDLQSDYCLWTHLCTDIVRIPESDSVPAIATKTRRSKNIKIK